MSNLSGSRIRRGSFFGLGFKNQNLRAVASAVAVLALATTGVAVQAGMTVPVANAQTLTPVDSEWDGIIDADGIANGYVDSSTDLTNAANTLSGMFIERDGAPHSQPVLA